MSDEKQAIAQNISLLVSQNRSAEARTELERLIALDPEDPESRSTAGDVYAWTGADGAAYKQYNLAADIFNRLGRADKALGVHHKILDLDTSMMDAATQARVRLLTLLVGAEDALVAGQNDKAVAGYTEAIRQFPNHTITYQRLASLLVRMGRHGEAVEQYLTVGRAFYAHGVLPKARPYFERVLELQPDQVEALDAVLACLKAEDKEGEGLRFLKSAMQAALERGSNEAAAAWFERLPEADHEGASTLGSALLLQSGEVGQAERMASQLDLTRPEVSDWYKRLGRAALDRGDSLSADVYFRWSSGQVDLTPVAPVLPPAPAVEAAPAFVPEPTPPPMAAPSPPPGLSTPPPSPPPGLSAPPPPPPPPGLSAPPPPPAPLATAPASLPPAAAEPPGIAAVAEAPPSNEAQDDKAILQTMGEMCLAEEMFEEAKQVFERLTRADPARPQYWELLNRARAGLGLHGVEAPPLGSVPGPPPAAAAPSAPPPAPAAPVPTPSAVMASPVPVAPATPPAPAELPPLAPPILVAPAPPPPLAAPVLAPPAPIAAPLPPPAPPVPEPVAVAPAFPAPPPLVLSAPEAPAAPSVLPPLPVVSHPPIAPPPPPLPLFAAAVEAAPEPVVEAPAPTQPAPPSPPSGEGATPGVQPAVAGEAAGEVHRPELEPVGRRGHGSIDGRDAHVERPSVEWGASPFAVGPEGAKVAEPHQASASSAQAPVAPQPEPAAAAPAPVPIPAPPVVLAPPPAFVATAALTPAQQERAQRAQPKADEKIPALTAVAAGGVKITRTAFAVQLGELPPAVLSSVDSLEDEIIE